MQPQSSHAIAGATRQEGPPKCRPAPTQSRPGRGANTQEPGRGPGLRLSAGERGARRPTPTPPTLWAHNPAHTPARAHRHTRAHAHRGRATDGSVGGGPEWFGARSRVPREGAAGRSAPPRPSNPPSRARLGLQSFAARPPRQRAGLGSARLCVAPDGRDRWPYRAPGCAPSSAPRRSRHPAPCLPVLPARPPAAGFVLSLLCALDIPPPPLPRLRPLRLRHPSWPVAPLGPARDRGPNCCRCCCCFCCCSRTRAAATRPPPRPRRPTAWRGTRTPSGLQGTRPLLWAPAPRTWSLSTCSGFMRNTAEGARGQEGATRSAASGPGWVSRGGPGAPFSSSSPVLLTCPSSHPCTSALPLPSIH